MSTHHRIAGTIAFCALVSAQNYALRFFGNGENDIDRVKILIGTPGNPLNVGNDFTIEFKIRTLLSDNPQGASVQDGAHGDWIYGHTIIDRDIFGDGDYGDFGISLVGGRIAFGVNNGTESYTLVSTLSVADGSWHDVAVTRSASGAMAIFIDGQLDKSILTTVTGDLSYRAGRPTTWTNDPYLVIGAEKHDYDRTLYPSFRGLLDELRISSTVRYTATYTPVGYFADDPQTVALYHFDEGSGTTALNSAALSGSQGNGTLHFGGSPAGPVWEAVQTTGLVSPDRAEAPDRTGVVSEVPAYSGKLPVFDLRGSFYGFPASETDWERLPAGIYLSGSRRIIHTIP